MFIANRRQCGEFAEELRSLMECHDLDNESVGQVLELPAWVIEVLLSGEAYPHPEAIELFWELKDTLQ